MSKYRTIHHRVEYTIGTGKKAITLTDVLCPKCLEECADSIRCHNVRVLRTWAGGIKRECGSCGK